MLYKYKIYGIINNCVQMSRTFASNIFKLIYFCLEQIYIIVNFFYLRILLIGFKKSQNSKNVCYYLFLLA